MSPIGLTLQVLGIEACDLYASNGGVFRKGILGCRICSGDASAGLMFCVWWSLLTKNCIFTNCPNPPDA